MKQGVEVVNRAGDSLHEVMEAILEIADGIANIADGAQGQASHLSSINNAISELDRLTQRNAAMFKETTTASHALSRGAQELVATVGAFSGRTSCSARNVA